MLTVIITTIGRPTLTRAIQSAVDEGFPVIVVGDGIDVSRYAQDRFNGVRFVRTGNRYGCYGAMAANLGMLLAETEFCASLGDDDEFIAGKGQVLIDRIQQYPDIDIWIPNLLFEDGRRWDFKHEVKFGYTPYPTCRTSVVTQSPFTHPPHTALDHSMDYMMVERAVNVYGYKIDWIIEPIYRIRPHYKEEHGAGKFGEIEFKMV